MKNTALYVVILSLGAGLILIEVTRSGHFSGSTSVHASITAGKSSQSKATQLLQQRPPALISNQWSLYRKARQKALLANPELQSEYRTFLQKLNEQQSRVDAAIPMTDPKFAPVLAKIKALEAQHLAPLKETRSATSGKYTGAPMVALTSTDLQEINAVRAEAIQTRPDLLTASNQLIESLHALNEKLNDAIGKAQPELVPVIASLKTHDQSQLGLINSQLLQ